MNHIISPYVNETGLIVGFYGGSVTETVTDEGYQIYKLTVPLGKEPIVGYEQLIDGEIHPATQEQIDSYWVPKKWKLIRITRNNLLETTDYRVTNHLSGEQALSTDDYQALLDYRQALRDITDTFDNPDAVIWPDLPAFMV